MLSGCSENESPPPAAEGLEGLLAKFGQRVDVNLDAPNECLTIEKSDNNLQYCYDQLLPRMEHYVNQLKSCSEGTLDDKTCADIKAKKEIITPAYKKLNGYAEAWSEMLMRRDD